MKFDPMAGMTLLRQLNEWKSAGGSDTDVLLALDDYVTQKLMQWKREGCMEPGHSCNRCGTDFSATAGQ